MAPRLPLPLAAGLYGVLLGLGFTTFVLTFAVWALAGVSLALGDPALGLASASRSAPAGSAGRRPRPRRAAARGVAASRRWPSGPRILRALRAVDGLAIAACAVALLA